MKKEPIPFPPPEDDKPFAFRIRIGGQVVEIRAEIEDASDQPPGDVIELPHPPANALR